MYPFLFFFYANMIVTKSGVLNKVKLKLKLKFRQRLLSGHRQRELDLTLEDTVNICKLYHCFCCSEKVNANVNADTGCMQLWLVIYFETLISLLTTKRKQSGPRA